MNFAIRYLTRYVYDQDVVDNVNALRVRPAKLPRQRVDEFSVLLTPEVRQHSHSDYFGTEVVEFEVSRPHRELVIDVRARVSTQAPERPPAATWEALREPAYREAGGEFLLQTDDAPGHPQLAELVAATTDAGDPVALLSLICDLIPDRFEYRSGATYVHSPLSAVLDGGAGVCQDFAHLSLYLLRHRGVAARYVSGYLFITSGEGRSDRSVEVDTHAWVEALIPGADSDSDPVWVGLDPTNRTLTTEAYVKIGHGRHYADVPPIKGIYRGLASSKLEAGVTMTLLDGLDPAATVRS